MRKIFYVLFLYSVSFLFAQENDSTQSVVSISLRAVTPIGIFADNWNTGSAFYLSYGWIFSDEWGVQFQTGYNKYRLKTNSKYSESPKLSMLAFQIGGRHYFLDGIFKPYVIVLSGVNYIRIYYKSGDILIDERDTHMNFQIGAGFDFYVISNLELEISALYNSHLINPSTPYNLTGFEYGLGINWIY